jgi:hypothetical protein
MTVVTVIICLTVNKQTLTSAYCQVIWNRAFLLKAMCPSLIYTGHRAEALPVVCPLPRKPVTMGISLGLARLVREALMRGRVSSYTMSAFCG